MEPTILKTPRIYNGAGIYNTGAGGGGGGGGGDLPEGFIRAEFIQLTDQLAFNRPDGLDSKDKFVTYKVQCFDAANISTKVYFGSLQIEFYPGQTYFLYPYSTSLYFNTPSQVTLTAKVKNGEIMSNYGNGTLSHPQPDYTSRYVLLYPTSGAILNVFEIKQEDESGNIEFHLIPIVDTTDNNKPYLYDTVSKEKWASGGTAYMYDL